MRVRLAKRARKAAKMADELFEQSIALAKAAAVVSIERTTYRHSASLKGKTPGETAIPHAHGEHRQII